MQRNILRGFAAILLIVDGAGACSRGPPITAGSVSESNVAASSDSGKRYDPTMLKEVKKLADLPKDVQTLADNTFMKDRWDGAPTKFLVGGVGGLSAVVIYEQSGYVPSYHAQSYAFDDSRWVPAKEWVLQSEITTLRA